jgi:putative salt-induced outer membrane protein YdiY
LHPAPVRVLILVLALLVLAPSAYADRVTVKGTVLEGEVQSIDGKQIVMKTVYGQGALNINLQDVEAIETDVPFHVFHGADVHTTGPVIGLTPGEIRVASDGGAETISLGDMHAVVRQPGDDADFLEAAEVSFPYWSANFDLGFNASQATDDSLGLNVGLRGKRERGPSRFRPSIRWRYGQKRDDGEDRRTDDNNIFGALKQEYDVTERWFVYGKVDGEYDAVDSLSFRTVPTVGAAYKLFDTENLTWSAGLGPAYVYQRFFGGETEDYLAMGIVTQLEWQLPFEGTVWSFSTSYTPSVSEWTTNYLIRTETALRMPLAGAFSLRAAVLNTYDNTPADGSSRNSLSTTVGLSAGF